MAATAPAAPLTPSTITTSSPARAESKVTAPGSPAIPERFAGFYEWKRERRLALIGQLLEEHALPPDEVAFLAAALADARLSALERNNIADALHAQESPDPRLYRVFITQIDDPAQPEKWRVYSVQHLALTLPYAERPEEVRAKLEQVAAGGAEALASRAMMMLGHLASQGQLQLDGRSVARLGQWLADPASSREIQMTALGLIGRGKYAQHAEAVRRLALAPSPVQRVAVATLGQIGGRDDIARLRPLLQSPDQYVGLAARAAIQALESSTAPR